MFTSQRQSLETMTDTELLERVARRRSTDAFEELYRRHASAITAIARRFSRDSQAADEATQSTFLQLWQCAGDLDVESRLRAWLATVVRNKAFDQQRRKRLELVAIGEQHDRAANVPTPEEHAIARERTNNIKAAMDALPDDQRKMIELAYFGGLSQSEISELTGLALGTVKSRTRLAMQRLRTMITGEGVLQ
jgi:RNA polymerase sigma-70 factor (ECF subfamily)